MLRSLFKKEQKVKGMKALKKEHAWSVVSGLLVEARADIILSLKYYSSLCHHFQNLINTISDQIKLKKRKL